MSQSSLEQFGAYQKARKLFDLVVADMDVLKAIPFLAWGGKLMERSEHTIPNGRGKLGTLGRFCLFLVLVVMWLVSVPALAQVKPQVLSTPSPKRVLLLYSYNDGMPAYQKATPAFIRVATKGGIDLNNLFLEYLDLSRNNSAEYQQRLAALRFSAGVCKNKRKQTVAQNKKAEV